jgi:NAD(P)-dependent dehydrogenase (short-subunit alcohol dehydrogenase family)
VPKRELQGKVAVVTGGGSGIGRAIAIALGEEGATLVIPDLQIQGAEETASAVRALDTSAMSIEADISDPLHVDRVFDKTLEIHGKLDILVNNAGTSHPAVSIVDLDLAYIEKIFAVDYKGLYLCSRRAVMDMGKGHGGSIINISSIAGMVPLPLVMYGPMKSAVNMLTRILAREWACKQVRVNAIAPGYVRTPLIKDMIQRGLRDPSRIIERTPLKTMLDPEDIAHLTVFLVSSAARHITGAILPVDGGWLSDGGWSAYPR